MSDTTRLAALDVGIPKPHMASEHRYSLMEDLRTALPSALLEYGVNPAPLSYRSTTPPVVDFTSPSEIALPSPSCPAKTPN